MGVLWGCSVFGSWLKLLWYVGWVVFQGSRRVQGCPRRFREAREVEVSTLAGALFSSSTGHQAAGRCLFI